MEDCCSSSLVRAGIGQQLIGGIAIDPTAVLGKDPTIISVSGSGSAVGMRESPEAGVMNIGVDTPQAKSAALPSQPAVQEAPGIPDSKITTVVIGKKPRGRPRKYPRVEEPKAAPADDVPANPDVPVKRGRGRPKKTVAPGSQAPGTPVAKRGKGRPKKTDVVATASPSGPKRGRGRPRKVAATTNGTEIPVVSVVNVIKPSLSITDPAYQSSSIDKTIENMIKSTAESPTAVAKRPVGRPRKRLLGVPNVVEVKQPRETATDTNKPISGTLKISKEMVDKMMEKGKVQQPSQQVDEPQVKGNGEEEGVTAPPPAKRRPGRPKKVYPPGEEPKQASTSQKTGEDGTPVKRKRGRPRKNPGIPPGIPPGLPPSPTKSNEMDARSDASVTDSPAKPPAKRPRGRPPKKMAAEHKSEDPEVMGKLQVSFSESESEGSDPLNVQRSAIEALDRLAPPTPPTQPTGSLFLENKFEESFDEDSDN